MHIHGPKTYRRWLGELGILTFLGVIILIYTAPIHGSHKTLPKNNLPLDNFENTHPVVGDIVGALFDDSGGSIEHGSADVGIDQLCSIYPHICSKTTRLAQYTPQEQLYYQALLIYMITGIDSRLQSNTTLQNIITSLTLDDTRPDRRGSAGHTHASFNTSKIPSWHEFFHVAIHEASHLVDLGVVTGRSVFTDTTFTEFGKSVRATNDPSLEFYRITRLSENIRKKDTGPEHFVSGYAMKNVYEDFAESMTMYLLYNQLFQQKAKTNALLQQKYSYIDSLLGSRPLQSGRQYLPYYKTTKNYRDITRLSSDLRP